MRKKLLLMVVCTFMVLNCCACDKNEPVKKTKDEVTELNPFKSVTDDLLVAREGGECTALYYYDYDRNGYLYACGRKNCSHNIEEYQNGIIQCDAIIDGATYYPFVYNDRTFYFVEGDEGYSLWSSKQDGTDKKKKADLNFTLNTESKGVRCQDKVYVSSREEVYEEVEEGQEEQVGGAAEVYEIDLSKGSVKQLTNLGTYADANCEDIHFYDGKLIISYFCREKTYAEAGFDNVAKYIEWAQSEKFSHQENVKRIGLRKKKYVYDLKTKKLKPFDIGFECQFEEYKGLECMDGSYVILGFDKDTVVYLEPLAGDYTVYSYNMKTKERKEIFSSFMNMETLNDGIVYITSMEMDEATKKEREPRVDLKQPPKYYSYNLETGELNEDHYGEEGKVFYAIDRNEKGLLVNETAFDENYESYDEHDIREINIK